VIKYGPIKYTTGYLGCNLKAGKICRTTTPTTSYTSFFPHSGLTQTEKNPRKYQNIFLTPLLVQYSTVQYISVSSDCGISLAPYLHEYTNTLDLDLSKKGPESVPENLTLRPPPKKKREKKSPLSIVAVLDLDPCL
jgi:hypothetical protein